MTSSTPTRRLLARAATAASAALLLALAGCAGLNAVDSSVAAYGSWPAGRTPGTYSFDRLPSQQANPDRQALLEAAASHALAMAGFRPAAAGAKGEVTVQIGARIERFETAPWDDPLPGRYRGLGFRNAWLAPYGPYGIGGPYGPYWGPWQPRPDQYQREVALLIRDAADGKPLYEARASSSGFSEGAPRLLAAMFDASMSDFPRANDKPHDVTVPLPPELPPQPLPPLLPLPPAASASASANLR